MQQHKKLYIIKQTHNLKQSKHKNNITIINNNDNNKITIITIIKLNDNNDNKND